MPRRALDDTTVEALRCVARSRSSIDPAHDWLHVLRVEKTAAHLARIEGADETLCRAASLLHELVNLPKHHPDSARSGELCAEEALRVMQACGVDDVAAGRVATCIRVHAWSAGLTPPDLESAILQDADRLDAIGAIGIARCFATCQAMGRPFYATEDPFCETRAPDDRAFGVDHFVTKLLQIGERLHTRSARSMARDRTAFLHAFLAQLRREIE
jgi:uncharacterized protein